MNSINEQKQILPLSADLLCEGVFHTQEFNEFILHSLIFLLSVETVELVAMLTAIVSLVLFSAGFVGFCCWKHPSIRTRTYWDKQTKKILRALYSQFLDFPIFLKLLINYEVEGEIEFLRYRTSTIRIKMYNYTDVIMIKIEVAKHAF